MSVTRRAIFALGATALLSGCAIEPPPTIRQQKAAASAAAQRAASSPEPSAGNASAPESAASSSKSTQQPTPPEAGETAGSARPASATEPAQANASHANHIAAAAPYVVPAATVHQWLVTKTGPATPMAFLTYDDGPSPNLTPQLLDALKQLGVHATFFVIGYRLEQNPSVAQRALAEGHAICLHSYSHDYSYLYPGRIGNTDRVIADFDQALTVAKRVLGSDYDSPAYRYPGGHMSWTGLEGADAALAARGVSWIDWNCMTGDAEKHPTKTGDQGFDTVVSTLTLTGNSRAAVMLSHDSAGGTVSLQSLPRIVAMFRDRGYGFGVIG